MKKIQEPYTHLINNGLKFETTEQSAINMNTKLVRSLLINQNEIIEWIEKAEKNNITIIDTGVTMEGEIIESGVGKENDIFNEEKKPPLWKQEYEKIKLDLKNVSEYCKKTGISDQLDCDGVKLCDLYKNKLDCETLMLTITFKNAKARYFYGSEELEDGGVLPVMIDSKDIPGEMAFVLENGEELIIEELIADVIKNQNEIIDWIENTKTLKDNACYLGSMAAIRKEIIESKKGTKLKIAPADDEHKEKEYYENLPEELPTCEEASRKIQEKILVKEESGVSSDVLRINTKEDGVGDALRITTKGGRLTNEEVVKKCVEISIENGWLPKKSEPLNNMKLVKLEWYEKDNLIYLEASNGSAHIVADNIHLEELLFDHEWAKCLFGDNYLLYPAEIRKLKIVKKSPWFELLESRDRIDYLRKYLKEYNL